MNVGIYPGTFDPLHAGHRACATTSIEQGYVDKVVFLPELSPRGKSYVAAQSKRANAIEQAFTGDDRFSVLTLDQPQFTVTDTLPVLRKCFPDDKLTLICGSDVALHIASWPRVDELLRAMDIIVAIRTTASREAVESALSQLSPNMYFIETDQPHVSSSMYRAKPDSVT